MFSGCGVYPINIAKNTKAKEIYGIEINPVAHEYAEENARLNKTKNIRLFLGNVQKVIPNLDKKFDRILMPLPKGAEKFLGLALKVIKKQGVIHLYTFLEEENINKKYLEDYLKNYAKTFKLLDFVKSYVSMGKYLLMRDVLRCVLLLQFFLKWISSLHF